MRSFGKRKNIKKLSDILASSNYWQIRGEANEHIDA
tara:strand:+ start:559 stop:666 length:108 start_codon:yes stop_codon:yes gene_type:complete